MDVGDDLAAGTVAAAADHLGGGYVGCEFASMFALFGTQVTLLQGLDHLLPREDSDVAAEVADILANQGVVGKIPVSAIPRAKTLHDATGTWKAVVDADTGLILGAALLGHNAGEVISTLQMAMLGGLSYQQVRDAVLTHPTMGEGLNLLFDALDDQQQAHGETSPAQISSG
jgi:pyruvate/2-oxoglutarate dehydrogenase complex dihydrolipoamide dehydrogenase (E3) component